MNQNIISLDTETTGVDLFHGAKPYMVTMCKPNGDQLYWEWEVDPLTREPKTIESDLREIIDLLGLYGSTGDQPTIVGHNIKFDVKALQTILPPFEWPWHRTHDTIIAGHILASNQYHDLTSMAIQYLGINIQSFEDSIQKATQQAMKYVRVHYTDWAISKKGREDMPSAKEKVWKSDMWLPRCIALHESYPKDHLWYSLLKDYGNADSFVTINLWSKLEKLLESRGLREIYDNQIQLVPITETMERNGLTINYKRTEELRNRFHNESKVNGEKCLSIAKKLDYDLTLPKSGNNQSLLKFCFGNAYVTAKETKQNAIEDTSIDSRSLRLPIYSETESGNPSLEKKAIDKYLITLDEQSDQHQFIKALSKKRSQDTAINYLDGYSRFWLPLGIESANNLGDIEFYLIHPSYNITGTDTLRWSCSNPNSQNVAKREDFNLRYCFGPLPNREWWSLDAKNIELRIPAYESGEIDLINLFERCNEPPFYGSEHLLNFSVVYPDIWDQELKEVGFDKVGPHCKKKFASTWYQWCKNGDFAVGYGSGPATADAAFHRQGCHALLKSRFAKKEELNQRCIRFAEKHGYVETIPDRDVNPKRGYPLMCTRTEYGKILPTIPLNYHTQGTAMWWTCRGMIRCQKQLDEWNHEALKKTGKAQQYRIVIQQHDELVFDFPRAENPKTNPKKSNLGRIRILQKLMEKGGEGINVPTPVGIEYHDHNWSTGLTLA